MLSTAAIATITCDGLSDATSCQASWEEKGRVGDNGEIAFTARTVADAKAGAKAEAREMGFRIIGTRWLCPTCRAAAICLPRETTLSQPVNLD